MEKKPSVLYRGLRIDYNNLPNFKFSGVDLVVNYEPLIDKYGRKTVSDGNEYGVYMSDNLEMVESAYGNLHNHGIPVYNNLSICNIQVKIPSVAIIYEINTENLDIREPFITDYLKGHYNNGAQGKEWITDKVPADSYRLHRIRIGSDFLHDQKDIDLSNLEGIEDKVKEKLEMRKYRLDTFASSMENIPLHTRGNLSKDELDILKSIYGKNGLKYINEEAIITSNVDGMIKYLIAKVFKQNESKIDFETIKYINSLKMSATSIDSLVDILKTEQLQNTQEKLEFIQKKEQEGVPYLTARFDAQEKRLDNLIALVNLRRKQDDPYQQEQSPITNSNNDNKTKEDQEWEMIKDQYDYDNIDIRKQQVIDDELRDAIFKRRMQEIGLEDINLFEIESQPENVVSESVENTERRLM